MEKPSSTPQTPQTPETPETPDTLAPGSTLYNFTVDAIEALPEINGDAVLMHHNAATTPLLFLRNDDPEMAFSITFRTPPADSTGVFHILEHSVLCGSDKFPVKEPFVNLLKTSMQTFLNAMTFPDKTMYPVATTNRADLINLTDVYMDAVLHPAIYTNPNIFRQEGWHIELAEAGSETLEANDECDDDAIDEQDAAAMAAEPANIPAERAAEDAGVAEDTGVAEPATASPFFYNGVVYNEMKGALSDPDDVAIEAINAALFPDTCYGFESGGDPEVIPQLTYEQFLDEHTRHYRLDNAYIVLYGNIDIDEMLGFLDEKYLTPDAPAARAASAGQRTAGAPREITYQEAFIAPDVEKEMQTDPKNEMLALAYVVGRATETQKLTDLNILLDALYGSNEAPLRRALLDDDLADDIRADLMSEIAQPYVIFRFRGLHKGAEQRARLALETHLLDLINAGFDRTILRASLSHDEFLAREHNHGIADGVVYAMDAMSTWLYGADPLDSLRYEDYFAHANERTESGAFEALAREAILESNHHAQVHIVPVEKLSCDNLACRIPPADTDADEVAATVAALRAAQERPDSPEELATLPTLTLEDVRHTPAPAENDYRIEKHNGLTVIVHDVPTHGIVNVSRQYCFSFLKPEDLPYLALFNLLVGRLATTQHTAAEIDTMINEVFGHSSVSSSFIMGKDINTCGLREKVTFISLRSRMVEAVHLAHEIATSTRFDDAARIKKRITQTKLSLERSFLNSGNRFALSRVSAYYSAAGVLTDLKSGVNFYFFIKELLDHFEERFADLQKRLSVFCDYLAAQDRVIVSFAGGAEALDAYLEASGDKAYTGPRIDFDTFLSQTIADIPAPLEGREAFVIPSNIAFVGAAYDRHIDEPTYDEGENGTWFIASNALNFDYLWNNVRVKGGAYGCSFKRGPRGAMAFSSYRDPHIDETLERYSESAEWLKTHEMTQAEFEGYIVSALGTFDRPLKPTEVVSMQNSILFDNRDKGYRNRIRTSLLNSTPEALRACADNIAQNIEKAREKGYYCVFGNEDIIKNAKTKLKVIPLMDNRIE